MTLLRAEIVYFDTDYFIFRIRFIGICKFGYFKLFYSIIHKYRKRHDVTVKRRKSLPLVPNLPIIDAAWLRFIIG